MAKVTELHKDPRSLERWRKRREEEQQHLAYKVEQNRRAFKDFAAHSGKLDRYDREAIAAELYWEVEKYKDAHPNEKLYELVRRSGLDANAKSNKVLDRLVLAPGADEGKKERLYADKSKYFELIRYLVTGGRNPKAFDDPQKQEQAGRRFLYRTNIYKKSSENASQGTDESHLVYDALLGMVNQVDQEFHLHEQFKEVARLREQRESVYWDLMAKTKEGETLSLEAWHELDRDLKLPHPDWVWPASDERFNEVNGLWWPLDGWRLTDENFWIDEKPRKPDSAFWVERNSLSPTAARVCDRADFFFVPHVYLGLCIDASTLKYYVESAFEGLRELPIPCASWDDLNKRYKLSQPEYVLADGGVSTDYQFDEATSVTAHWLVIYPDPKTNKLVPMIYALGELTGAELIPLTPDLIADFGEPGHWKYFSDDAPTLLQRLKDLTGYRAGDFRVYDTWRETAARFHWNPVLRKHPDSIEDIRYRKRLLSWRRSERFGLGIEEED